MNGWRGEYDCYAQSLDDDYYYDFFTGTNQTKIETPLDKNGLVDHTRLAAAIILNTPDVHRWNKDKRIRKHHYQWPNEWYPYETDAPANPGVFVNLPINQEKLPLSFERRIHHATLPPPVPDYEVMRYSIEADRAAHSLFWAAREIIQWQRKVRRRRLFNASHDYVLRKYGGADDKDRPIYQAYGRSYSRGFSRKLAVYQEIPPDFKPVETGGSPHQVAEDLGRALGTKTLWLAYAEAA